MVDRSCLTGLAVRTLVYPDCCLTTKRTTSPATTTTPKAKSRIFFMYSACSQVSASDFTQTHARWFPSSAEVPQEEDARRIRLLIPTPIVRFESFGGRLLRFPCHAAAAPGPQGACCTPRLDHVHSGGFGGL